MCTSNKTMKIKQRPIFFFFFIIAPWLLTQSKSAELISNYHTPARLQQYNPNQFCINAAYHALR